MPRVSQIFASLQGESSYAGRPCVFVRLSGCDVGCRWCDTRYAASPSAGRDMTLDGVEEAVARLSAGWGPGALAEITGGEPLMQADTPALARRLSRRGPLLVETGGTRDIGPLAAPAIRVMDVKCPSSGATDRMDWANLDRLRPDDEVKFVVADRADTDFAYRVIGDHCLEKRVAHIHLSPVWGELDPAELARWMLERPAVAQLQLPLHKVVWPTGEPSADGK